MLRRLIEDFKEFPATMVLGTAWVLVFALMVVSSLSASPAPSAGQILLGNFTPAHQFGDMTVGELFQGQPWRAVTCTFVHYNVLHIAMNLYGLYQLGCLIESWYGAGQFFAIYALIGGGGNFLSGLVRKALGSDAATHSGGGSTVVLGLVALCAVVGWRSKTRFGDYLRSQMVKILVLTAILGLLPIIDNWGHAGGALVGASIGLAHPLLVRNAKRPASRSMGAAGVILLLASGAAQLHENRWEKRRFQETRERIRASELACANLIKVEGFYRFALQRADFEHARFVPRSWLRAKGQASADRRTVMVPLIDLSDSQWRELLKQHLALLDAISAEFASPPTAADFQEVRRLLARSLDRAPTASSRWTFRVHWNRLIQRAANDQSIARRRLDRLARKGVYG